MHFAFTAEQDELRRTLRAFLEQRSPESEVRRLMATEDGYDADVWAQMAQMLGLQGLTIPEQYGGSGFTFVELVVVFEEMGRALVCAPYLATVALAASALLGSGDDAACAIYLPRIATGEMIATVATGDAELRATRDGDTDRITGSVSYVLDGASAHLVLVPARTDAGATLFAVDGSAVGMTRTLLATLDQTRKLARIDFDATPATRVGADGAAASVLDRTLQLGAVALAAEQVGGAARCLEMSVDYAKQREQFGRPIGSFQAIKHRCADLLVDVESARSAAYYAGWCAAQRNDELPTVASLAKSYCSEAYFRAAAANIQIHGGIGFTWEHPAHLYFKRARASAELFGSPDSHRLRVAELVGF